MENPNAQRFLLLGIKLLAVAGVAYAVYLTIGSLFTGDSWPPKDDGEEEAIIAKYKQKLRMGDSPLSPRTPEDTARYLGRIIDHEVKKGELKSGREYIRQAIRHELDERVEDLAARPGSKTLIAKVRNGVRKREGLLRVIAHYERRPGETAEKASKDQFDQELKELCGRFSTTPFEPAVCPELAEEILNLYRDKLAAAKRDPRLGKVVQEVEARCLTGQQ
jgi:hypothetical protein